MSNVQRVRPSLRWEECARCGGMGIIQAVDPPGADGPVEPSPAAGGTVSNFPNCLGYGGPVV